MPATLSDAGQWVDKHGDALYRFALARVRSPELAEEMVQETFLAALRAKDSFAGRSSERTWLIGILKRKVIDYYRKYWRERPMTELETRDEVDGDISDMFDETGHWRKPPETWTNPRVATEQNQFWVVFEKCMQGLPERQAQAFYLREVEGMESDEIRQVLQITPTNLWAMLHRARVRLRACLEENWFVRG